VKHPETGYKVSYRTALNRAGARVAVLGESALTNVGTRVAQEVTLENWAGETVYGVRVRAQGLDNPSWLKNRTGLEPVSGSPILEIPCVLLPGSQMVVRLVYHSAYQAQAATRPVTYKAWAVMAPVSGVGPVSTEMAIVGLDLYDGLSLLDLPVNRNRLYTVYQSDDSGATWTPNSPSIRATANDLMWLDTDAGAPPNRLYRVVDSGL
jgi:hypothetical protein